MPEGWWMMGKLGTAMWKAAMALMLMGIAAGSASAQSCGDADANGNVTVSDGVQALRAAAALSSICAAACDVDGNGAVTVSDGVSILRKSAGLAINEACDFTGEEANAVVDPSLSVFDGMTKIPGIGGASAFAAAGPDCDNDGTVQLQQSNNAVVLTFTNCQIGGNILDGQISRVVLGDRFALGFEDFEITRTKTGRSLTFDGQLGIADENQGTRINGTLAVASSEGAAFSLNFTRILLIGDGSVRQGTLDYDLTKTTVGKIARIQIVFDTSDELHVTVTLRNQQVRSFLLDRDTHLLLPAV
jgi:hypothetical protein